MEQSSRSSEALRRCGGCLTAKLDRLRRPWVGNNQEYRRICPAVVLARMVRVGNADGNVGQGFAMLAETCRTDTMRGGAETSVQLVNQERFMSDYEPII